MRYEKNVRYSLLWWTNCRFKWKYTILLTGKSFLELSFPVFVTLQSAKDFRNFINLEPSSVTFLKGCNCWFVRRKLLSMKKCFLTRWSEWGNQEILWGNVEFSMASFISYFLLWVLPQDWTRLLCWLDRAFSVNSENSVSHWTFFWENRMPNNLGWNYHCGGTVWKMGVLAEELIRKLWCIYTMEYYSAI